MPTARKSMRNSGTGLPVFQGILPIKRSLVSTDIVAGVTLAALAMPEAMGYAKIAGAPVIAGLYTMLIPMVLFAISGSSRHLVVGADSATAVILFAGLSTMAAPASAQWMAYAGALALMSAGLLLMARVIRIGFLADFLSRTVLVGFLTGVGVQVALGEIPGMLGFTVLGKGPVETIMNVFRQINHVSFNDLAVSVAALLTIVVTGKISRKIPGALIAVIGSIAASSIFHLHEQGVHVLGAIPGGLPTIAFPEIRWKWDLIERLLPTAFSMFVVILAQSAATSRAYATRHNERFSQNIDLLGLGLANIGAGLSGTFLVNGSPTKTQMVETAGGRSQLSQIAASAVVFSVLLFLTAPLSYMPSVVLSAVVFLIGIELIDIKGMRRVYFERPWEFWVALVTALIVVFSGVEQGILTAMFLSIVAHTRHGYRPRNAVIKADGNDGFRPVPVSVPEQMAPGLMVYRFTHSMYYANTEQLYREVIELAEGARPRLHWFCIDAGAIDDVDFSAAETLRSIAGDLKNRGISLVLAEVSEHIREELDRSQLTRLIGRESYYGTLTDVLAAYRMKG
ncbi:MAG: SulP family inorganic anion transporter [Nitrospiraceae bacterium]|nr:SulP family inorganic anion transporter [Nitrospiraceae bacterium]